MPDPFKIFEGIEKLTQAIPQAGEVGEKLLADCTIDGRPIKSMLSRLNTFGIDLGVKSRDIADNGESGSVMSKKASPINLETRQLDASNKRMSLIPRELGSTLTFTTPEILRPFPAYPWLKPNEATSVYGEATRIVRINNPESFRFDNPNGVFRKSELTPAAPDDGISTRVQLSQNRSGAFVLESMDNNELGALVPIFGWRDPFIKMEVKPGSNSYGGDFESSTVFYSRLYPGQLFTNNDFVVNISRIQRTPSGSDVWTFPTQAGADENHFSFDTDGIPRNIQHD